MTETETKNLAKEYGYTTYLVERYIDLFGLEETIKLLEANERKPFPSIRCNTLRVPIKTFEKRMKDRQFTLKKIPYIIHGYQVLKSKYPLGATPEYLLGFYYIQGTASMIPVYVLDPQPGELVIDACAAPGGKTTQIAQLMKNKGTIIAVDLKLNRLKSLCSNLSRCNVRNTIVLHTDARKLPTLGVKADKVLLDAPCTGEGLICIDPSRKTSRKMEDIHWCSSLQKELLTAAIKATKTGGHLVYSTCSIAPEENEEVIQYVLEKEQLGVEVEDTGLEIGENGLIKAFGKTFDLSLSLAKRFYPHKHTTEGFFFCLLKKK